MIHQPTAEEFALEVRNEADFLAAKYPDHDLATVADALESHLDNYDRGETLGRAVTAELRARHEAGTRYGEPSEEEEDEADWTADLGPWRPIITAPKDAKIDLWVDLFELSGEVVENCWWNAGAVIPDWYRLSSDGEPALAAPIYGHAAFWKAPGAAGGPVQCDAGPGLLARTNVADDAAFWPEEMRARYELYLQVVADGRIDEKVTRRGRDEFSSGPQDEKEIAN